MSVYTQVSTELLLNGNFTEEQAGKIIEEKIKGMIGESQDTYAIYSPGTFEDQTENHWKISLKTIKGKKYANSILDAFGLLLFAYVR